MCNWLHLQSWLIQAVTTTFTYLSGSSCEVFLRVSGAKVEQERCDESVHGISGIGKDLVDYCVYSISIRRPEKPRVFCASFICVSNLLPLIGADYADPTCR